MLHGDLGYKRPCGIVVGQHRRGCRRAKAAVGQGHEQPLRGTSTLTDRPAVDPYPGAACRSWLQKTLRHRGSGGPDGGCRGAKAAVGQEHEQPLRGKSTLTDHPAVDPYPDAAFRSWLQKTLRHRGRATPLGMPLGRAALNQQSKGEADVTFGSGEDPSALRRSSRWYHWGETFAKMRNDG